MAEQDFDINIRTVADLTGARKAADAIAILNEQAKKSQAEAAAGGGEAARLGEHIGRGFERVALHAVGAGLVPGAIDQIKRLAEEINKISDSLEKQGEALVHNSREIIMQSKFARDDADVLKIAEAAMKNIAEQHKTVAELQAKELNLAAQITAEAAKFDPTMRGKKTTAQERLDAERAQAQSNEQAARATGMASIRAAEIEKERRATQTLAETIKELNDKIKEQQRLMDLHFIQNDIQGYLEAKKALQEYKNELADVIRLQKEQAAQLDKVVAHTDAQTKAIIANEQAARAARAAGDTRSAEMYEKSASALRAGASPQQKAMADWVKQQQGQITGPGVPAAPPGVSRSYQNLMKNVPPGYDLNVSTGELVPKGAPSLHGEEAKKARELEEKQHQVVRDFYGRTGEAAEQKRKEDIERTKQEQLRKKIQDESTHGKGQDGKSNNADVVAAIHELIQHWS